MSGTMNAATKPDAEIDILAIFAEIKADQIANPEKWAALAAEADKPATMAAERASLPSCRRCSGSGKFGPWYIEKGICFDCGGHGKEV